MVCNLLSYSRFQRNSIQIPVIWQAKSTQNIEATGTGAILVFSCKEEQKDIVMKKTVRVKIALLSIILVAGLSLAPLNAQVTQTGENVVETAASRFFYKVKKVRCDHGASLSRYLRRARPGDTLRIYGNCNETIVVVKNNLRLTGEDGASIDGSGLSSEAVILIESAKDVIIENLMIINGNDQGILATRGASGILSHLVVKDNATVGISIDRSQFELSNIEASSNGTGGLDIFSMSTVVATGPIDASDNRGDGIAINGKTFFELRGSNIVTNGNAGSGLSVINDSRLQVFSFPEAQGSGVTASNNGFAGIGILGSELGVVGSQFFGSGANIFSVNNNVIGFFMPAGAILSPHATAQFQASGNQIGMLFEDGGKALIVGGVNLSENGLGLQADGANTINIVSVPPNPSQVVNNDLDVNAAFGSRLTFTDVESESLVCDSTVLVRGTLTCPTSP